MSPKSMGTTSVPRWSARCERQGRVDVLEPVVEEEPRRDAQIVTGADAAAEPLVRGDRVVLVLLVRWVGS